MKYEVFVKEIWSRRCEVEANSLEEAMDKANEVIERGEDAPDDFEYHHTLESDQWTVYNKTEDKYEQ